MIIGPLLKFHGTRDILDVAFSGQQPNRSGELVTR